MIRSLIFRSLTLVVLAFLVWTLGAPWYIDILLFVSIVLFGFLSKVSSLCFLCIGVFVSLLVFELGSRGLGLKEMAVTEFYRPHEKYEGVPNYIPNIEVTFDMPYGDLAAMDPHLPKSIREPRTIHFKSDSLGYNNLHEYSNERLIIAGDSFAAGTDNDINDSISNILINDYNIPTYSIAHPTVPEEYFNKTRDFLPKMINGASVLVFVFEGNDFSCGERSAAKLNWYDKLKVDFFGFSKGFLSLGPSIYTRFRILSRIVLSQKDELVELHRVGDADMAFYGSFVDCALSPTIGFDIPTPSKEALAVIKGVFLVPTKYRVYYPLINEKSERSPSVPPPAYEALMNYFAKFHIPTFDLTPALQSAAKNSLAEGKYIYWRDDTHWNQAGIKVAAKSVVDALNLTNLQTSRPVEYSQEHHQ